MTFCWGGVLEPPSSISFGSDVMFPCQDVLNNLNEVELSSALPTQLEATSRWFGSPTDLRYNWYGNKWVYDSHTVCFFSLCSFCSCHMTFQNAIICHRRHLKKNKNRSRPVQTVGIWWKPTPCIAASVATSESRTIPGAVKDPFRICFHHGEPKQSNHVWDQFCLRQQFGGAMKLNGNSQKQELS